MQFKGSLRSPGDRGPGIRVSLEVDEYHLQIQRGTELIGRWYLADVEVVRDIAERFTLFLNDDEMEFLADDALVFAYEGVTRMQQGWIKAQKKKRRHRRAAAEAARRKDEAPDEIAPVSVPVPEPAQTRRPSGRSRVKAPSSELANKLAAIAAAEDSEPAGPRWVEEVFEPADKLTNPASAGNGADPRVAPAYDWATAREEMAIAEDPKVEQPKIEQPRIEQPRIEQPRIEQPSDDQPAPEPDLEVDARAPGAGAPVDTDGHLKRREATSSAVAPAAELWLEIQREPSPPEPAPPPVPAWLAPVESSVRTHNTADFDEENESWAEPAWVTPPEATIENSGRTWSEPSWLIPDEVETDGDLRSRYEALEQAARATKTKPEEIDPQDEPEVRSRRGLRAREPKSPKPRRSAPEVADDEFRTEVSRPTLLRSVETKGTDARNEGHHPIESSTGLLAKLRRAPKVADDHVHVYQESRSTVGLTRRVCLECSHVSISSD